jgi:tetratricopeptide (TPR) repeat protein
MTTAGDPPSAQESLAIEAFHAGRLEESRALFMTVLESLQGGEQPTQEAETRNNLCVVLLQLDRAEEACEVVKGTPAVFLAVGDTPRAAMSYGNLGAALEACGQPEAALQAYQEAVDLFKQSEDSEAYKFTLQAISRLQLRSGNPFEALTTMQVGLDSSPRPGLRDRIVRRLLDLPARFLNK